MKFFDLRGEFARRLEDEGAGHSGSGAALFEHGQHGQHEGGGLASAGLRNAENVTARKDVGEWLVPGWGSGWG